jgi:hypothetical protein
MPQSPQSDPSFCSDEEGELTVSDRLPALFAGDVHDLPVTPPRMSPVAPTSSSMIDASPVRGTPKTKKAIRKVIGQKKRQDTLKKSRAQQAERARDNEISTAEQILKDKHAMFDAILTMLNNNGLSFAKLVEYVSDPKYGQGNVRYQSFFRHEKTVVRILDHWVSKANSNTGRAVVHDWCIQYSSHAVNQEARELTASRYLQKAHEHGITADFILGYNPLHIFTDLSKTAPVTIAILSSAASLSGTLDDLTQATTKRKQTVSTELLMLT